MNRDINNPIGQAYNPYPNAPLNPYAHQQQQGLAGAAQALGASPVATRFSVCAGHLEGQLSTLVELINRANRIADRLGGAVPQGVAENGPKRDGSCVVAIIESSLEDFGTQCIRLNGIIERLEAL
jgi:hypothetical protein